jgi:hypothetical protein
MNEVVARICTLENTGLRPEVDKFRILEPVVRGKLGDPEYVQSGRAVQSFSLKPLLHNLVFDVEVVRKWEENIEGSLSTASAMSHTFVRDFNLMLELLNNGDTFETSPGNYIEIKKNPGNKIDLKKALRGYIVVDKDRAKQCDVLPGDVVVLRPSEFIARDEYLSLRRYA